MNKYVYTGRVSASTLLSTQIRSVIVVMQKLQTLAFVFSNEAKNKTTAL